MILQNLRHREAGAAVGGIGLNHQLRLRAGAAQGEMGHRYGLLHHHIVAAGKGDENRILRTRYLPGVPVRRVIPVSAAAVAPHRLSRKRGTLYG